MAKDRTPEPGRPRGGASRPGAAGGKGGRTRPPVTNVVAPQRPWGLIAAAVVVVVFAAAVIVYAVQQVNRSEANQVSERMSRPLALLVTGLTLFVLVPFMLRMFGISS